MQIHIGLIIVSLALVAFIATGWAVYNAHRGNGSERQHPLPGSSRFQAGVSP